MPDHCAGSFVPHAAVYYATYNRLWNDLNVALLWLEDHLGAYFGSIFVVLIAVSVHVRQEPEQAAATATRAAPGEGSASREDTPAPGLNRMSSSISAVSVQIQSCLMSDSYDKYQILPCSPLVVCALPGCLMQVLDVNCMVKSL